MSKPKQLLALTLVAVVAIVAGAWFLLVAPKRAQAAQVRAQQQTERQQIDQLRLQLSMLKQQAADLPAQQAKLVAIAQQIPDNPALPTLVRNLSAQANKAGVELVSLTPAKPTAFGGATAGGTTTLKSANPVPGLMVIPVTLQVSGGFPQMTLFLSSLEQLQRSMVVTGFSVSGNYTKGSVSAATTVGKGPLTVNITGQVFMAPGATGPGAIPTPGTATTGTAK